MQIVHVVNAMNGIVKTMQDVTVGVTKTLKINKISCLIIVAMVVAVVAVVTVVANVAAAEDANIF